MLKKSVEKVLIAYVSIFSVLFMISIDNLGNTIYNVFLFIGITLFIVSCRLLSKYTKTFK